MAAPEKNQNLNDYDWETNNAIFIDHIKLTCHNVAMPEYKLIALESIFDYGNSVSMGRAQC